MGGLRIRRRGERENVTRFRSVPLMRLNIGENTLLHILMLKYGKKGSKLIKDELMFSFLVTVVKLLNLCDYCSYLLESRLFIFCGELPWERVGT